MTSMYPFRPSEPVCFVLGKRVKVVYRRGEEVTGSLCECRCAPGREVPHRMCPTHGATAPQPGRLSIIGLDLQIITALAKKLHKAIRQDYDHSDFRDTTDRRGLSFEVKLESGRIARVTVELDRVESRV